MNTVNNNVKNPAERQDFFVIQKEAENLAGLSLVRMRNKGACDSPRRQASRNRVAGQLNADFNLNA